MTRFAQGTNPEYVATINNAMYGDGKDDPQVQQELLEEANNIGPTGEGPLNDDGTPVSVMSGDDVSSSTTTAGFMGIPNIAWIAIVGVGLYYAYSQGMFKKLLK
jgi:hypothetical protein